MSYQSAPAGGGATETRSKARPSATAHELIYLVSRVAAGFEAILKTKESALSLSQWAILELLRQEGGRSRPSQVARKLGFSRQLIRQAAKKLMSLELVEAEAPDEGKKAVELTLTGAGRETLADIGTATEALAETLNSDERSGSGVNHAARTLKLLSVAIAAQIPDENTGTGSGAAA